MTLPDDQRGLYEKFRVERLDGSSAPGGKHEHCQYFVLDLVHDPHALSALRAYALSCRQSHPKLADDLEQILRKSGWHLLSQEAWRSRYLRRLIQAHGYTGKEAGVAADAAEFLEDVEPEEAADDEAS